LELQKDEIILEGKNKHSKLVIEKEKLIDLKREKEFELDLLENCNGRVVEREETRL